MTALLHTGLPRGSVGARSRRRNRTGEPAAYDFRRPPIHLSREHARILALGFDAYARQVQSVLTATLRALAEVHVVSVDQRTYAGYVDMLDASTFMTTFAADPIHGTGVLEIPLVTTMTCIDLMLGGQGGPIQPVRPLTEIESSVIRGLIEALLAETTTALAPIVALDPVPTGVEYSPALAQVAGPEDAVLIVTLEVHLQETTHRLTLCLPFSGLLPHVANAAARVAMSDREQMARERAAEQMREQVQHVPLEVSVRFAPTQLSPQEVNALQVGDVVRLSHRADVPLDVTVDGTTFAHATTGTHGRHVAALVVALPNEES
ncbi:MAG: flagellar motor switch protein FliM [Candidatus Nanopelagicales bacterium]